VVGQLRPAASVQGSRQQSGGGKEE
jgi:hypothetical protein